MIIFWILAATMMAVAVALILPPLLGHGRHATVSREAVNLAIFNERLADLEQDEGDAAQRDQVRREMERELIQDVSVEHADMQTGRRGSPLAAIAVGQHPQPPFGHPLVPGCSSFTTPRWPSQVRREPGDSSNQPARGALHLGSSNLPLGAFHFYHNKAERSQQLQLLEI